MEGIHGVLLIATGILHTLVTFTPILYSRKWLQFLKNGLFREVRANNEESMAAFWFMIAGPLMIFAGMNLYFLELLSGAIPSSIGICLLGISILGAIMMPKSGFTLLLLPQAIFLLV